MARRTQQQAVLEWLKTGAGITSMEAFRSLGATRLSAIVFELRRKGYDIDSEDVTVTNRMGAKVKVARYYLRDSHADDGDNVL